MPMKENRSAEVRMVGVQDIRDINQTVFLHLIREKQPISRADIAKSTGLRAGTVSSIVNRLIKNGFVYEGTEGPSSGGRRPKYLYINPESFYVLAIDIGVTDSVYAVSDFNGRILQQRSMLTEGEPNAFLNHLADSIEELVSKQFQRARFAAVGVSLPEQFSRKCFRLFPKRRHGLG
jgi:predicted transcriptional regulator